MSPTQIFIRLFALCLTSIPVAVGLSYLDVLMHDHLLVFIIGVVVCSFVAYISYPLIFKHLTSANRHDPYLYLFTFFAWTTIIDIQLAMTIDGHIGVLNFYLEQGERYLQSAYGSLINWWDGTVHFSLYMYILVQLATASTATCRDASLYYVGSIMNSLFVFLPGNVTGPYGTELKASYLLNVPFCIVPLTYLARVLSSPRSGAPHSSSSSALHWPLRLFFFLFFSAATVFSTIRVLTVFRSTLPFFQWWGAEIEPFLLDTTTYPQWQATVNALYYIPFFLYAAVAMLSGRYSATLADCSVLAAGALAQGGFSLFPTVFYERTASQFRFAPSSPYFSSVAAANLALFLVPHLFALYVTRTLRAAPSTKAKRT